MTEIKSYAAEGLPFELRCENARKGLEFLWGTLLEIAANDADFLERQRKQYAERMATSSDAIQAFLRGAFEDNKQLIKGSAEDLLAVSWRGGINMLKPIWGDDAVDFALKAMEVGSRPQKN